MVNSFHPGVVFFSTCYGENIFNSETLGTPPPVLGVFSRDIQYIPGKKNLKNTLSA